MQYSKLGNTGINVSRICLGCMSYGDKKWRDWVLTMDEARDHFAAAVEAVINSSTPPTRLLGRRERRGHRSDTSEKWRTNTRSPWRLRRRPDVIGGSIARASARNIVCGKATRRCAGSKMISSTSTKPALDGDLHDADQKKRSRRSTRWSRAGKVRYLGASSMAACGSSPQGALSQSRKKTDGTASSRCKTITTSSIARRAEMNPLHCDNGVGLMLIMEPARADSWRAIATRRAAPVRPRAH